MLPVLACVKFFFFNYQDKVSWQTCLSGHVTPQRPHLRLSHHDETFGVIPRTNVLLWDDLQSLLALAGRERLHVSMVTEFPLERKSSMFKCFDKQY